MTSVCQKNGQLPVEQVSSPVCVLSLKNSPQRMGLIAQLNERERNVHQLG